MESTERENMFDGLISRLDTVEVRIQEREDKSIEITQNKRKKKKI